MEKKLKQHLSPHFTLYEFVRSGVAIQENIDNMPNEKQIEALTALCENVLEKLRQQFGPIVISSGFRCRKVNNRVGGVAYSQHCRGEAADIVFNTQDRGQRMLDFIRQKLDFDQLILEPMGDPDPRWIHVSYTTRRRNRHEVI